MGFGPAPNRFLLDKMAEYGRGEVDYISEVGDTSAVAQRFQRTSSQSIIDGYLDRLVRPSGNAMFIRNAFPIFSVLRPLIFSGRYTNGGKGTIRLKGKMAGQDFVREIPVELPEKETDHDVLATLWGRRRIDDLMRDE